MTKFSHSFGNLGNQELNHLMLRSDNEPYDVLAYMGFRISADDFQSISSSKK
jgi:hypothetical protein